MQSTYSFLSLMPGSVFVVYSIKILKNVTREQNTVTVLKWNSLALQCNNVSKRCRMK